MENITIIVNSRATSVSGLITGMNFFSIQIMDETVLIKEILAGDTESFAILIDSHKNSIFNLCYRMLGNYEDAEDISQETFIQAWRKLGKFGLGQKFRNWLFTIALNLCKNRLRKNKIIKFFSLDKMSDTGEDELPFEIADKQPTPEEALILAERKKKINDFAGALPPKYRSVFLLRYSQGLSYEEISRVADLPIGTVETWLFRTKKMILKNSEIFSSG